MPLNRCQADDKPGWKWGDAGKCYVYTAGNEESETAAKKKALAQASAMGEFPGTGNRSQVEHRSATLQDVDKRQRLVDVIAVPYNQETEVEWHGGIWRESHDPKAYNGIEDHAGRIQVNREHVKGRTVGKIVQADPGHKEGLFARAFIYPTDLGDETLTLAEHGGAFPSVGFRVNKPSDMRVDTRSKTRRILKAFLDHLAFVEDPAYPGAEVLAVRAGQSPAAGERPLPKTPKLDEFVNDPVFAWATGRTDQ